MKILEFLAWKNHTIEPNSRFFMTIYVNTNYKSKYNFLDLHMMLNEAVWDTAVAGCWAYFVSQHGSKDPGRFLLSTMSAGFMQPLLTYGGFDGIFKKKVKFLSPMLSTTFCYGISLYSQYALNRITLSDNARFIAIASIAHIAMVKGLTRKVFERSPYPSLAPLVTVPAEGFISLCEGISSLFSKAVNSQFVRLKTDSIYWAISRFRNNPCQDPEKKPKEA